MEEGTLQKVLRAHSGRLTGDGVAVTDLQEIIGSISDWSEWFDAWSNLGNHYESKAEECLVDGSNISAGEFFWMASLAYQYAQFLWFHEPEKREYGQRRKEQLYLRATPYLNPLAKRFSLPIDNYTIPGYLRIPNCKGPVGCIVLLGGLESTKEESYLFEQMCLRRGIATCTFDGPGQGEMFFQTGLRPDFEKYCSRVIDYLGKRPEIDTERIGVLGRSLGSYYAVRCAALDKRIKACVCWGALYDLSWWEGIPSLTKQGFIYVTKLPDPDGSIRFLKDSIDLSGIAENLTCPLYVLHGGKDTVIPGDQVQKLEEATSKTKDRTFMIEPNGNHCCHNMYPIVRPRMADWVASRLHG